LDSYKDPRSKTAEYSEEKWNPKIPLTPFFKGGNPIGHSVARSGEYQVQESTGMAMKVKIKKWVRERNAI
jgi:hypothetical protein